MDGTMKREKNVMWNRRRIRQSSGRVFAAVLAGIMAENADVIAFSVYIWNVDRVRRLIRDIRKIRGADVLLFAGGPEATYYPESFLGEDKADLCMLGEGEEVFAELLSALAEEDSACSEGGNRSA